MKRLVIIAAALVLTGPIQLPVGAQDASEQFVGEATVNVINVPVRVVDRKTGEPVTGLGPEAFRILESGTEQTISNFSEIDDKIAVRTVSEDGVETRADDEVGITKPLEIIYFFDLFLMYKSDRDRAIEGLESLYADGVPEGESVSVVVFDDALETLVDRSDERREILEGIEELKYIKALGINQRITFTEALSDAPVTNDRDTGFYERRQRNTEYMIDLERKISRVGNALLATMARYARADGRRILVAFTPGFPKSDWSPTYYSVDFLNAAVEYPQEDLWRKIGNEASDLGFTLYTVDTSGLTSPSQSDVTSGITDSVAAMQRDAITTGATAIDGQQTQFQSPNGPSSSQAAGINPAEDSQNLGQFLEYSRKYLLISTAEATGGNAIFTGDVAASMDQVLSSLDHYYSIGYTADHIGDGQTYEIEVELDGHPNYQVVHRTAYVDLPASTRTAQALRSEMLFGGDANPLGIRVELGKSDSRFRLGAVGSKRVRIPINVKIPYSRLMMVPRGDVHWGKVQITFFGEDPSGNQSELASFEQPITVAADRYDEAVARGYFSYSATVEVEGGEQTVYVGVQDTLGGRTSIIPYTFDHTDPTRPPSDYGAMRFQPARIPRVGGRRSST